MIADAPIPIVFADQVFDAAYNGRSERKPVSIGGFTDEPAISIVIALKTETGESVFTTPPGNGDTISIRDELFRVEHFEIDPFGESIQLDLITPAK